MLVIPRGAPHGFACTSEQAGRLLTISTPARVFEAGVAELCASKVDGDPAGGPAMKRGRSPRAMVSSSSDERLVDARQLARLWGDRGLQGYLSKGERRNGDRGGRAEDAANRWAGHESRGLQGHTDRRLRFRRRDDCRLRSCERLARRERLRCIVLEHRRNELAQVLRPAARNPVPIVNNGLIAPGATGVHDVVANARPRRKHSPTGELG